MDGLTTGERKALASMMSERKKTLREEIRTGLTRIGHESHADLLSGTADAGDESTAMILSEIANAEVARDARELQDIVAAEARMDAGTYGVCIDCGVAIPSARLLAYPSAKRCLRCQQRHETTRAAGLR